MPGTGDVLENKLQMFPFIWSFYSSEERQRESKCTSKHLISGSDKCHEEKQSRAEDSVCVFEEWRSTTVERVVNEASLNKNWVRSRCKSLQKSCSSGQNRKYKGPVTRVCVG